MCFTQAQTQQLRKFQKQSSGDKSSLPNERTLTIFKDINRKLHQHLTHLKIKQIQKSRFLKLHLKKNQRPKLKQPF